MDRLTARTENGHDMEQDEKTERLEIELAALRAQLDQTRQEMEAAVKCISDVETYLNLGSPKYINLTINEWRGRKEGGNANG